MMYLLKWNYFKSLKMKVLLNTKKVIIIFILQQMMLIVPVTQVNQRNIEKDKAEGRVKIRKDHIVDPHGRKVIIVI